MLNKNIKNSKNMSFGQVYQKIFNISFKPIMLFVGAIFVLIFIVISSGSVVGVESYSKIFVYISFFLSVLILFASFFEKIKDIPQTTKMFVLIVFIFSSIGYAVARVKWFPECIQFEDLGTAIVLLLSYFTIFLKKKNI